MENIIELQNGALTARINLSRGASCISLRDARYGARIIREPDYEAGVDNPFLYGIPLLYPQNRISGGEFIFEGRRYTFPINEPKTGCHLHGDLHSTEFYATDRSTHLLRSFTERDGRVGFPHRFRIEMIHELSENALIHRISVTNLSDMNMPHFLGFHTTFNLPFCEGSHPEDVSLYCELGDEIERDMSVYLPTGRISDPDEITSDIRAGALKPAEHTLSRHYKAVGKGEVRLIDNVRKIALCYEIDEKLPFRLIYNGGAKNFICLEPLGSMANCQNSPFDREYAGFDFIEPGKTKEYIMKIYLTEEKI